MPLSIDKFKLVRESNRRDIFLRVAVDGVSRAFLGCSDFKVYDFDLTTPKSEPAELGVHGAYVTGVVATPSAVISGGYDGRLIWWDRAKRTQIRAVDGHKKWVRDLCITRDGKTMVSVADDMVARVWDTSTGKLIHELRGHAEKTPHYFQSMLYACAVSADGHFVATGDKIGRVIIWEMATGKKQSEIEAPIMYTWDPTQRRHSIGGIRSLAFSPDGKTLAVGGMGKVGNIDHLEGKARVEIFDWASAKRTHEFPGDKFNGLVEHLEFHSSGDWLLAAGGANDGFLMFFDVRAKTTLRQEKVPTHVHDAALVNNEMIVTAGHNRIGLFSLKG
jgi:WD40 repeat protein